MLLKKLAQDTAIYGGADFLTKILAFATFPIIAAVLSPRAFGIVDLITTIIGLLGLLANCGLNNAVQRFYWDQDTPLAKRPAVVSTGLFALLTFSLLLMVMGIVSIPLVLPQIIDLDSTLSIFTLICAAALIAITQTIQYIQDVIRLHFTPVKFLVFSLLGRVMGALAAVYAVAYLYAGIDGLFIAQAVTGLCAIPIGLYMIRKDLVIQIDKTRLKELLSYGYPFIFTGLAYWLFGSMDRWMLATMSSVEETGIYSVAFRFATIVLFVSMAFGQAWSPYAIKMKTEHPGDYRQMYADILLVLVYVMLIVGGGISLFSGEIIYLLMPDDYQGSSISLSILCFAIVFQATQQITASGISLEKKTKILSYMAWAAALINFTGNWFLIPVWGAAGAATATLIAYLFLTSGYIYWSQKLHPIPVNWKRLGILLCLGTITLTLSLWGNTHGLEWNVISIKLGFAFICLIIGFYLMPRKSKILKELQA